MRAKIDTIFNQKGMPLVSVGSRSMLVTEEQTIQDSTPTRIVESKDVAGFKVVPWFDDNVFPNTVDDIIKEAPVLGNAISTMAKITLGQGIFPCNITGYDDSGQETLEVIQDDELNRLLPNYMMRRYLSKTEYDLRKFGIAFIELIPSADGKRILKLNPVSAKSCRLETPDAKTGVVKNVIVSGKFSDEKADKTNTKKYLLLDEIDPLLHLQLLIEDGTLANQSVFMVLKNSFSSNDFYPLPDWYRAKYWVDIARKVPKLISAGMDNVMNVFILVRIPYTYWDKKYPEDMFETTKERKAKIQADIDMLQTEFTDVENAKKSLITHFGDPDMNGDDKWEIELIEPKFNQENFVTSTAADTQTAIAVGINPDLLGLMYGNSKGGSMQRELLLLQYALSWEERQKLADPIEMMLQVNGYDAVQIRFRNTFLTTLDTGSGTDSNLS